MSDSNTQLFICTFRAVTCGRFPTHWTPCRFPSGDRSSLAPPTQKMNPPAVEVADILRAQGQRFLDRYRASFDFQQLKAFRALQNGRTAGPGGPPDACPQSEFQPTPYNSFPNRPCPNRQPQACD